MFVQGVRILENGGNKKDCLFAENWVIIANNYFGENFMCGAASVTPPTSNNDKFQSLSKKRAYDLSI